MKNQRNSSLELLRIICMLLIITHHYSVHGGYDVLSVANLSMNGVYIQILSLFGRPACSVFVLISGYYLIEYTKGNHYRRVIPLIAEMLFYSIIIACVIYCFDLVPIDSVAIFRSFFPMLYGNWFVISYLVFYMFVPFINPLLRSLTEKSYCILLFSIIIIWSVIPTICPWYSFSFGTIDFFIVFYIIGAFIKLHHKGVNYSNRWNLLIGLGAAFFMILSVVAFDLCSIMINRESLINNATFFMEFNTIPAVVFAVFIFLFCLRATFYSKFINTIAKSVLGVYLIHDNIYLRPFLWTVLFPNSLYINNVFIHSLIKIIGVYIICLVIDLLRAKTIGRVFDNWFYRHCDSIVNWIKQHTPALIAKLLY